MKWMSPLHNSLTPYLALSLLIKPVWTMVNMSIFFVWSILPFYTHSINLLILTYPGRFWMLRVRPNLGRRMLIGVYPPSKAGPTFPPERAYWPLWPLPEVLPFLQPGPLPLICFLLRAP